jgi:hypothetical protein
VAASVDALCQRVQAGLTQATFEQKRHLVELLIDRVVVTDGDVAIRYVIPTTSSPRRPPASTCGFVICVQTISTMLRRA